MRQVRLKNGSVVSALGLGTWRMGESRASRAQEVRALQTGLELGATLIDTAEMYGDGGAEEVVGEAIQGRRDEVYIVSKVLPDHATRNGTVKACESSLKRLGTDWIDLYLLHWWTSVPLEETMAGFQDLLKHGKIRGFGVSNLNLNDMKEWTSLKGGDATLANQVQYSLDVRGTDFDLSPWCRQRGIAIMAYCPLSRGSIPKSRAIARVMQRHKATAAQIMLAWTMRQDHLISIPKSSHPERVAENVKAADIVLLEEDLADLDTDFPAPARAEPLSMS